MDKKKIYLWVVLAVTIMTVAFCGVYRLGRILETRKSQTRGVVKCINNEVITYNGINYVPQKRITTILIIGVDKVSGEERIGYRNGGQADLLLLLVIDDAAKTVTTIQIDRDTMAEITVLGVLGNEAGTTNAQICLSHGFGDGKEQSSLLTVKSLERLLLGVRVDYYLTMNLDGISVLNDEVGGVSVTLQDDFSSIDPIMTNGTTLTLQGEQAEYYVRSRMSIGIGTNEARMKRQGEYMEAIETKLNNKISEDSEFIGKVFDDLDTYLLTNMARGFIINVAWNTRDYSRQAIIHPHGEYVIGDDGFMEFHVDEVALERLVMETFYEPVK